MRDPAAATSGTGTGGAGAAAAAAAAAALAATAAPTVPPLTAAGIGVAVSAQMLEATAAVLEAADALFRQRRRELPIYVRNIVQEEIPGAEPSRIDQLAHEETRRELEFQRRARARIAAELPLALAEADAQVRAKRVKDLIDREKRYLQQRAEASASRVVAALEADLLRGLSPDGAYWQLSPLVREHTLDCIAMGGKFWPWEVLEHVHPQLHAGCMCRLLSRSEAVAARLMNPDDPPELGTLPPEVREEWIADSVQFAQAIVQESLRLQEQLPEDELTEAVMELEQLRLMEAAERWGKGHSKGGQFKPKRGGTRGTPTRSRRAVRGLKDTADRLKPKARKRDAEPPSKAQDPRPVDSGGDGFKAKQVQDLKQGDVVMVNGKPDEVVEVRNAETGLVVLKDTGLAMIDPARPVRVKDKDAPAPTADAPTAKDWHDALEAIRNSDHDASRGYWSNPVLASTAKVVERMPVGTRQQLAEDFSIRREEHGWIVNSGGHVWARSTETRGALTVAGDLYLAVRDKDRGWRAGRDKTGGLKRIDPALLEEYENAKLESEWHTSRRLEQGYKTPDKRADLRYDWRASAAAVGLTVEDLDAGEPRQRELIAAERAARDHQREVQKRVYRQLLKNRDAFEVIDHSQRLGTKPFQVSPRSDTVGVLGGDSFLRENGANLNLSRFKTRESAQKAIDKLHERELARINEELGPEADAKPPKPPEPEPKPPEPDGTTGGGGGASKAPAYDELGGMVDALNATWDRWAEKRDWGTGENKRLLDYHTNRGTPAQQPALEEAADAVRALRNAHRDLTQYEAKDYMRERRARTALGVARADVEVNRDRLEADESLPEPIRKAALDELKQLDDLLNGRTTATGGEATGGEVELDLDLPLGDREEIAARRGFTSPEEAVREIRAREQVRSNLRESSFRELLETRDAQQRVLRSLLRHPEDRDREYPRTRSWEDLSEPEQQRMVRTYRMLEELTTEVELRRRAAGVQRREMAREEGRRTGKLTITAEERRELLGKTKDVYRDAGLVGPDLPRPEYNPDLFRKSDLSGSWVRYYVELPDGRIAHPDELNEAIDRGRIIVAEDLPRPENEAQYLSDRLTDEERAELLKLEVGDRYRIVNKGDRASIYDSALVRDVGEPRGGFDQDQADAIMDLLNAPTHREGRAPIGGEGGGEGGTTGGEGTTAPTGGDDERPTGGDGEEATGGETQPEPEPTPPEPEPEPAPPAPTGDEPKPSYEQVSTLLSRGAPEQAGVLVPGFFNYTGERGQVHEDEHGVMQLQWYFFRQSKDRRTRVAFTHLGNRLARDAGRDEKPTARMYAGLAGPGWQELTLTKPDEAADVATLARERGYPLRSEVADWLSDREGPQEAAELTRARELLGNVSGKTFTESNDLLSQAGYAHMGIDVPDEQGRRVQVARNFDDGYDLRYSFNEDRDVLRGKDSATGEGQIIAHDTPMPAEAPTVGQNVRDYYASDTSPEAIGADLTTVNGWEQVITPTGEGFAFQTDEQGNVTEVRSFPPTQREANTAREWGIRRKPGRYIVGMPFSEADDTMSGVGYKNAPLQGYSRGHSVMGTDVMGSTQLVQANLPEGVEYVREFRHEQTHQQVLAHLDADGNVVRAGRKPPAGHLENGAPAPWAIAENDAQWEQWREAAEAAKRAELDRRERERRERTELAFSGLTDAMKQGRKGKVKDEALRELFSPAALASGDQLVTAMIKAGWGLRGRRNSRVDGQRNITYTLRGPDGSTVKIRSALTFSDRSVNQVELIPNKVTSRERLPKGQAWRNKDELYQDALGRADELAERHGGVSFVTTIIDNEGSGKYAIAHHEWNGAIVMSKSSGFANRFSDYLKKREAGETLTDREHLDFYDAMSTLQHEINHGVGKAGENEGGLAFGSRHYRKTAGVLSAHGVMEEALTEESARILTLEWLRDQGMDDVLVAVKRKVGEFDKNSDGKYTDYTMLGSYQDYRRRLQRLFDEAKVPENERRDLVMRMKFEMSPEERMAFLDDRLGHIETSEGQRQTGYTPGRRIMGTDVRVTTQEEHMGRPVTRTRKAPLERPVVPDLPELTDVEVPALPHEAAQIGDEVQVNDFGERKTGVITAFDEPWEGYIKIRQADGTEITTPRAGILAILSGPSGAVAADRQRPVQMIDGKDGVREVGVGDAVRVRSSSGEQDGVVVELSDEVMQGASRIGAYIKVRTEDGLALWVNFERVS